MSAGVGLQHLQRPLAWPQRQPSPLPTPSHRLRPTFKVRHGAFTQLAPTTEVPAIPFRIWPCLRRKQCRGHLRCHGSGDCDRRGVCNSDKRMHGGERRCSSRRLSEETRNCHRISHGHSLLHRCRVCGLFRDVALHDIVCGSRRRLLIFKVLRGGRRHCNRPGHRRGLCTRPVGDTESELRLPERMKADSRYNMLFGQAFCVGSSWP